jgi:bifunctional UDP-N-acetylglucosamine pyrophosphorylase/glucosamine-1-phosphate N-acetyltransferase
LKAVILAAGKGVRMRPLTDKIPKAMVKLRGKPLLEWNMEKIKAMGIAEVAMVVGYKKEAIVKYFKNEWNGMKITYIDQPEQLGTADALKRAKDFVGNDEFLLIHCDVIVSDETFKEIAKKGNEFNDFDVLIAGREVPDPWRYGVLMCEGGKVKGIDEKPAFGEAESNIINAGFYRFTSKIFTELDKVQKSARGEYELPDALRGLMKKNRVELVMCKGKCFDIGDLEDLGVAEMEVNAP